MSKRFYGLLIILSFLVGVWAEDFFDFGFAFISFFFILSLFVFFVGKILREADVNLLIIIFIALAVGMSRTYIYDYYFQKQVIPDNFLQRSVLFEGIVLDEPDVSEKQIKIKIALEKIGDQTISGIQSLIFLSPGQTVYFGDRIYLKGKLDKPKSFLTDSGEEFDYEAYLAKDSISYISFYPTVVSYSKNDSFSAKSYLFKVKNSFVGNINLFLPEPRASLANGILVGAKQGIPEDLNKDFQKAGLSHLVVLSGYNVTIIANNFILLFSKIFGMQTGLGFGVLGVLLFAIMTGAEAGTVRATIMVLITLLAKKVGRVYDSGRALVLAGLAMVLYNPKTLVFDTSFQLSFLATAGLVFLCEPIDKMISGFVKQKTIREMVASTLAAQLGVLPVLVIKIGQVSLLSIVANVAVLWLVPVMMALAFLLGILGFFNFYVSMFVAFVLDVLLMYLIVVAKFFSAIPFSVLSTQNMFSFIFVTIVYVLILSYLFKSFKTIDNGNSK